MGIVQMLQVGCGREYKSHILTELQGSRAVTRFWHGCESGITIPIVWERRCDRVNQSAGDLRMHAPTNIEQQGNGQRLTYTTCSVFTV